MGNRLLLLSRTWGCRRWQKVKAFADPGTCPAKLAAEGSYQYIPKDESAAKALEIATGGGQFSARWVFKHKKESNSLDPWGVCIVMTKQVLVPGGGSVSLM